MEDVGCWYTNFFPSFAIFDNFSLVIEFVVLFGGYCRRLRFWLIGRGERGVYAWVKSEKRAWKRSWKRVSKRLLCVEMT